jgi:hypothetical protein
VLNASLFERVLAWFASERGELAMLEARRAFEAATGSIIEGASDYEHRITHFLEQQLCEGEPAPIARFVRAQSGLSRSEQQELAGWLRSHRSLFVFEGYGPEGGLLQDCILGGVYRIWPSDLDRELSPGDRFDARLLPLGEFVSVSPGRVFHPPEAHAALDALIAELDLEALPRAALLNALLLMRSRFLQFESVRAEHVYQEKALAPVRLRLKRASK